MSENIHTCDHCNQTFEGDLTSVFWHDCYEEWCPECVATALEEEMIVECEHCGQLTWTWDEVITTQGNWRRDGETEVWCRDCVNDNASRCDECDELFANSELDGHTLWNGREITLCYNCNYDAFYTCEDCCELVHADDMQRGSDDEPYCPNCIDRHVRSENLHGYHHTSGSWFWLDDGSSKQWYDLTEEQRKAMYLGIELETDGNDDASSLADDIAEDYGGTMVVCKEDGSLDDEGVEIVSQPMTPKYHLEGGMWEKIADIVIDHGGRSHDAGTCGLHIHISRAFFTDDAVYRLDRLFHRFRTQLLRFSRRSEYQLRWCSLEEDDLAEIKDVDERKKAWGDKKRFAGRYEAINNTNGKTVEVRLWRGTLNMTTFKATVQLTAGLALIVNKMEDRLADTLTWSGVKTLVRFALESEGIGHNELDEYLASRDL
ncbi:MAG: hypothetical protein IJG82_09540 [Atopobiaceae bacterium]|nr:hypothetical protein [Atopobiaceae bacterium]